jgi:TolB protein
MRDIRLTRKSNRYFTFNLIEDSTKMITTTTRILLLFLFYTIAVTGQTKYKIAYKVAQDSKNDDYEIYSMNLDGTDKRNITNHKDVAWTYYAWKNRLFFISDRDNCKRCYFLYEMEANGTNIRKMSDLRLEDSWMGSRRKSREMVVSGGIGTDLRYQLFVIDLTTGKYKQLTNENGAAFRDRFFRRTVSESFMFIKRSEPIGKNTKTFGL